MSSPRRRGRREEEDDDRMAGATVRIEGLEEGAARIRRALEETPLRYFEVSYDEAHALLVRRFRYEGRPSFSPGMVAEAERFDTMVSRLFSAGTRVPLAWVATGSTYPGVFGYGGDLARFVEYIRTRDRPALETYANGCVDVVFRSLVAFGAPVATASVVEGDALGGGFEAALAHDLIIAEEQASFGFPEILFNLFPGMGAVSILGRRIGMREAEALIASGRTLTAREAADLGIVDIVAPTGGGFAALREHIRKASRRAPALRALRAARRLAAPVSHEELRGIAAIWVETALSLDEADLRRMQQLVAAQDRRRRPLAAE